MYNTNDEVLTGHRPGNISEDLYKKDLEAILDDGAYHSDEVSETNEEKAQNERDNDIRPKNKEDTDHHVIHVYDKPWRSRRVSK
jgi:hypothetical protein